MDKDPVYIIIKSIIFLGVLTDGVLLIFFMVHLSIENSFDFFSFMISLSIFICIVFMNWFYQRM